MAGLNSSQNAWPYSRASHHVVAVPGLVYLPSSHELDLALPSSHTQCYDRATIEVIPHWCCPGKMFPYTVRNSLPLLDWNSGSDISQPLQDFHPRNVTTRQHVIPPYHEVSPLPTQFQTSGIELRHEDAIGSDSYWSPNLPSSVMRDDNSILSFQAANKLQRDVFGQLSVDTCDAVGVQSVVTQTETPRRADAHLNTEVSMAAPDGHAEETQTPVKSRSVCTQTEAPGTADAHLNTELNTADLHPVAEESQTPVERLSVCTQTEAPGTADAHLNTDVNDADLEYFAEAFVKLKETNEELRKRNMTLRRAFKKESSSIQRAQQAELSLLALHYTMCRMHCSRLCSNPQGKQSTITSKTPQANMAGVVQKLESDYHRMRQEILSGVRLEQLEPLSVDLQETNSEGSYIPSQMSADLPDSVQSGTSQEQNKPFDGENGSVDLTSENSKRRNVQTAGSTAARSDPSSSEAWFDAEEYLDMESKECQN